MGSYEYEEIQRDKREQARTDAFELWKTTEEYQEAVQREYERLLADPEILEHALYEIGDKINFTELAALIMHKDVIEFGNAIFKPLINELKEQAAINAGWNWEQYR